MRSRALAVAVVAAVVAWLPAPADAALTCNGHRVTINGTRGADILTGTSGPDVIHGRAGNDFIVGLTGADILCGGSGNDVIYGGGGNDTISGQAGNDTLDGGGGHDHITGNRGTDSLGGGTGNDHLDGGPSNDHLIGSAGSDHLFGGDGDDVLAGRRGTDALVGEAGDDHLNGGPGDDALIGSDGTDRCIGADGSDSAWTCEVEVTIEIVQSPEPVTQPPAGTVALTFDDGPHPDHTPKVLDILDEYGVAATFFIIGQSAEQYPEIVHDMVRRGHSVLSHTYSHAWLTRHSNWSIEQELTKGAEAVAAITGSTPRCYRPPYGAINSRVRGIADGLGYEDIMWDVDPWDWKIPGSSYVSWHILRYTSDGDVILLHDPSGPSTYNALPDIIEGLRKKGLEFVSLCG